ncbi:hypothetical protein EHO60_11255 [Leptospira fletcheri]|uniref:Uncharacterized protein n=1 Tax=Leptospira fletcheri TaxID=2484981 RepID=A0A4R9GDQ4_9LEPT|nr:hypothetical protein [Leptospira fletcheri]TGK09932.1 hypothetical protein EHO60_11255 [Leptospira fletcheri]
MSVLFLLQYVRPEFFLGFFLFAFYVFLKEIPELKYDKFRKDPIFVSFFILFPICLVLFSVLFPVWDRERSVIAFFQHYALRMHELGRFPEDPWTNAERAVFADFGPVNSIFGALRADPYRFFLHVGRNLSDFAKFLSLGGPLWLGFSGFVVLCALLWQKRKRLLRWAKIHQDLEVFWISAVLPPFLGISIVYPRIHYLILVVPFLFFLLAAFFRFRKVRTLALVYASVCLILGMTSSINKSPKRELGACSNLSRARFFQSKERIPSEIRILSTHGSLCMYLGGKDCKYIEPYRKGKERIGQSSF